ncbi:BolA family protein [Aquicella lusitana]|uniref:Acid stress-induced BolA-like protein IbaG/YrbA n=1 Tax=Aquicella lusitana TaxID=254246 RepID=A0A370G8V7_9COXI|nr:BolA family protein [Aquicella lusitana]RDI38453.1 acid stress-induced BolA-like protein IbaG/YrbA [Aquicella lusitana]VVC73762.1 Acid stress protein IbaG [Aquicella lusitana]
MQPEEIKHLIEAGLKGSEAYVEGDGTHFTAAVICPVFAGRSRIQKQQLVYDTVRAQLLDGRLHALSITTFTPEEWQQLKDDLNAEES